MTAIAYTIHSPARGRYVVSAACRDDVAGVGASPGEAFEAWLPALYAALSTCGAEEARAWASPARAGESAFELGPTAALKFELHVLMKTEGVTQGELARRMGIAKQEAHRICSLAGPTKIETILRAFAALGRRVDFGVATVDGE